MIQSKVGIILQARLGSSRFPKKIIQKLGNYQLIDFQIKRLRKCKSIDSIILATTCINNDESLKCIADINGIEFFQGESNDVLKRYLDAAVFHELDIICRITGDCPFSDPKLIDASIDLFRNGKYEYVSNNKPPTYPDGLDIEVFSLEHLRKLDASSKLLRIESTLPLYQLILLKIDIILRIRKTFQE